MKKFKNKFAVTGPESLLKAFEEELIKLGYKLKGNIYASHLNYITLNGAHYISEQGCYTYAANNASEEEYNLPQDWNLALQAASEVEEEIPKYVKCTCSHSSNFIEGNIYRVISWNSAGWELCGEDSTVSGYFKPNYSKFEISTKAAYNLQQQELADKELLEKLIKESGLKIGDIVIDKSTVNVSIHKIDRFKLITKENFNKSSNINTTYYNKIQTPFLAIIYNNSSSIPANYCTKVEASKTLTLGSSNIEIKISKGKIEATGREFNISWVKAVLGKMRGGLCGDFSYCYPTIKIGCSTFTLAELEQIVETYNELNK